VPAVCALADGGARSDSPLRPEVGRPSSPPPAVSSSAAGGFLLRPVARRVHLQLMAARPPRISPPQRAGGRGHQRPGEPHSTIHLALGGS
jgi:hypothetical protein